MIEGWEVEEGWSGTKMENYALECKEVEDIEKRVEYSKRDKGVGKPTLVIYL